MKKILCPTDFSDTAHNAIAYAAKFAQATGYELTLFHLQSLFDLAPAEIISGQPVLTVSNELEALREEVSKTFKIPCDAIVEPSLRKLSSVIHDRAEEYDLIIMGSNGADDLNQFFFGSNAYKAAIHTKTPLLLIPKDYVYSEIRKIIYAFDYLQKRDLPLNKLIPFAKKLKCEITVLQVMEEARSEDADEELQELQTIIRNFYADDVLLKYATVRSADTAQGINSYISRMRPDLLAVCSIHMNFIQRLFHKSVIKNIAATSDCPVFIFHE